jgi:CheY-like chemotaxis protein/signal transduction histidine kinase
MSGADGALFEHSPVAIIVADPGTQLVLASNAAARTLYGYSEEEFVGLPLHKLCDASFAGKARKHICKDGGEMVVDARAQVARLQGGEAAFLFITDRSEEQRTTQRLGQELSKAHAALRAKSELLSMLSHQIRTPLAGVTGMAALLAETNLSDRQRDFLDTIRSSSDVLMTVMSDVGDLSKIEERTLRLEAVDFDLRATIEDVVEIAGVLASQKKLELRHELDASVPVNLKGDPGRLKQILLTLLENAVGMMEAGVVRLSVTAESGLSGQSAGMPVRLKFELAESGGGISSKNAKLLRQSFVQADSLIGGHLHWPAVGLSICKRLAHLMDGEIGMPGEAGRGTIFWFSAGFSLTAAEGGLENALSPAGREVLLVQRSSEERAATRGLLEAMGMVVSEAGNAPQALALCSARGAKQEAFPLVLVDWNLPVIDGIRLARLLRGQPNNQEIQVVLLAVSSAPRQVEEAREAGAVDVLVKPLRRRQLASCLASLTAGHALREGLGTSGLGKVPSRQECPPHKLPEASGSGERAAASILVVEDNLVNQMVVSLCLQKLGYAVQIAEDGLAAVDAFSGKRFDLILMDCHMPRMDGASATRKIREMGGHGSKVPILALTADVFEAERDRCIAAGMNDFLSKPIRADLLKSKLEFWLEQPE